MEEEKKDSGLQNDSDIITNFLSFIRFLRKHVLLMIVAMVCGGIVAIVYYYKQKPKYHAICTFMLEEKQSGIGGLSSIASQFGFDVGGLGGGSMFAGDNILDILRSKRVVKKVLLSKMELNNPQSITLADHYLNLSGDSFISSGNNSAILLPGPENNLDARQDSLMNAIYQKLVVENIFIERLSRQSTIIKVQVNSQDRLFSKLMTERLVSEASQLYLDIRIGGAQDNIRKLQRRSDSLLALLNNKTFSVAANRPLDVNPGILTANVPTEIVTRDKSVLTALYTEVTKNLEGSKLLLSQQTPVIQVLDAPGLLLEDNRKSLLYILMVCFSISGFIYLVAAFVVFLLRQTLGKALA